MSETASPVVRETTTDAALMRGRLSVYVVERRDTHGTRIVYAHEHLEDALAWAQTEARRLGGVDVLCSPRVWEWHVVGVCSLTVARLALGDASGWSATRTVTRGTVVA